MKVAGAAGLATAGAVVGVALVEQAADRKWDLRNPGHLREFLPGPDLYPGYYFYFGGQVFFKDGTKIYAEPRGLRPTEEGGIITVPTIRDTLIETVSTQSTVSVFSPLLYLKEATAGQEGLNIFSILGPDGVSRRIDKSQSWVIFAAQPSLPKDINRDILENKWRVGCVNMADTSIRWQPSGREQMGFDPTAIYPTQTINLK